MLGRQPFLAQGPSPLSTLCLERDRGVRTRRARTAPAHHRRPDAHLREELPPTAPRPRHAAILPNRHRHPLRHAAARGRLAAGDRRGRRPRPVRAQVPRRRPGAAGAGGRADRRRDRPRARACRCRRSCFVELDAGARPQRAGPGDPGPAQAPAPGSTWRSTTCPARSPSTRCAATPSTPSSPRAIVWFDAFVTNVDRTPRNTNLLVWHKRLWLIDHGAALYFHHNWHEPGRAAAQPVPAINDHVLLPWASRAREADRACARGSTRPLVRRRSSSRSRTPGSPPSRRRDPGAQRAAYVDYLTAAARAPPRCSSRRRSVPARSSFDYAIVRVVPRVEREEFVNAGVILFCLERRLPRRPASSSTSRACGRSGPRSTSTLVRQHLDAIPRICAGGPDAGPIGRLAQRERFHWLVAPRSTIIQTSPVHSGLCDDPEQRARRALPADGDGAVEAGHEVPAAVRLSSQELFAPGGPDENAIDRTDSRRRPAGDPPLRMLGDLFDLAGW